MKVHKLGNTNGPGGFTLIGLLLVLVITLLLAAVASSVLASARQQALQLRCATNLRQVGSAALAYAAADELGRFPDCSGGFWPWDIPAIAAKELMENGLTRNEFYCPANPEQNNEDHWRFTASPDSTSGFRVIGYSLAFRGGGRVLATNITESLRPAPYRMADRLVQPGPSERVLSADATLSVGGVEADRTRNRYTSIVGGSALRHRSAHLNGKMPSGGNLLFMDGHTEWRPFLKMRVRTSGDPAFWW